MHQAVMCYCNGVIQPAIPASCGPDTQMITTLESMAQIRNPIITALPLVSNLSPMQGLMSIWYRNDFGIAPKLKLATTQLPRPPCLRNPPHSHFLLLQAVPPLDADQTTTMHIAVVESIAPHLDMMYARLGRIATPI